VDQIFDRFERLFKSWVTAEADLFGRPPGRDRSGNPDLDAAMDELDDFLSADRTETEARERAKARRAEEEARRAASGARAGAAGGGDRAGRSGPRSRLERAFRTLGLAYGTPFPEVKAAYKRLLMQNHPDRNSATPEQLRRSTEISAMLNEAYSRIETWHATGVAPED
jgi:DnaJ-domain-containing protein 1